MTPQSVATELGRLLKQALRRQRLTYAQLARAMGVSPSTIKRLLGGATELSLARLVEICRVAHLDVVELMAQARGPVNAAPQLSRRQEQALASDEDLFLGFYCVVKGLAVREIVERYQITEARLARALGKAEALGLVKQGPQRRVSLCVPRTVRWRENGPLMQKYERHMQLDLLGRAYAGNEACKRFVTLPLAPHSRRMFVAKLNDLLGELERQSQLDVRIDPELRETFTVLVGARAWTPAVIARYARSR